MFCPSLTFASVSPAVQIIPAQVSTPTAIKVLKQSRGPRAPRISGGEERSSPGNRTGSAHYTQKHMKALKSFQGGGFVHQIC